MDPVHTPRFHATDLDGKRRCPLYLTARRHARLPAHHWRGPGLALHQRSRLHHYRHCVRLMLFDTEQWRRIVPTSPLVLSKAWNTWVHYATFHMPVEPNGFYGYNALQQIAYFAVFLSSAPRPSLTGIAMSPAVVNRFPGTRGCSAAGSRRGRSTSSPCQLPGILVVHVTLVVMRGLRKTLTTS